MLGALARRVSIMGLVSISAVSQTPSVTKWVAPEYPSLARYLNCSGHIEVFLTIRQDGTVETAHAAAFAADNQQVHLRRLFPASEEAAKKWLFNPSTSTRHIKLNFAYQLYPPDTPESRLTAEQVSECSILIKAKALPIEHKETQ